MNHTKVFFSMKRVSYSVETKYKAVEMKAAGFSTKEIMKELNIRNRTQVKTWWRWYRNGESYRFSQQVGKQYTYGKGLEELSEVEQLKLENKRKDIELDILKSTRHWKGSGTNSSHRFSESIKSKIFNKN